MSIARKPRNNTERCDQALARLRKEGGEAVRHGAFFVAGGFNIADAVTMQGLADRGCVVIETVGASTFATIREGDRSCPN